jgi:TolA-binding protein
MKGRFTLFALMLVLCLAVPGFTAEQPKPSKPVVKGQDAKFEEYRKAIKERHGIDIRDFRQGIRGGRADARKVTDFELKELLMGIEVEQEHTTDKFRALEISMDHLAEFPDYYTRLKEMEEEADKEHDQKKKKG